MSGHSSLATPENSAVLGGLPPSAKLVAKTLEYEGDLTQSQLAESTLLPTRTVRDGLAKLEEHGLVTSEISFVDARMRVYSLDVSEEV